MKAQAVIKYDNGNRRTVYIHADHADLEGRFDWATTSERNSDQGYHLLADGTVEQVRYRDGEIQSRERLAAQWEREAPEGYTVSGTDEMVAVGIEALEALRAACAERGEEVEVAEIRVYENCPIEAVFVDDNGAETLVWNRDKGWVER